MAELCVDSSAGVNPLRDGKLGVGVGYPWNDCATDSVLPGPTPAWKSIPPAAAGGIEVNDALDGLCTPAPWLLHVLIATFAVLLKPPPLLLLLLLLMLLLLQSMSALPPKPRLCTCVGVGVLADAASALPYTKRGELEYPCCCCCCWYWNWSCCCADDGDRESLLLE